MQNYMPNGKIPYNNNTAPVVPSNAQNPFQPQYQTPPATNPNYAGVNIQIINPMVNSGGGYIYPQQTDSAYNSGTQGGCYPSNYYTTQPGAGYIPGVPAGGYPQSPAPSPNPTGFYDKDGKYHPYVKNGNGQVGYYDENGQFKPLESNTPSDTSAKENTDGNISAQNGFYDKDGKFHEYAKGPNGETGYYDENGQFHPINPNDPNATVPTDKPNGENTVETEKGKGEESSKEAEQTAPQKTDTEKPESTNGGKTEKRKVVELSNDYVKTLENYLNSQDVEIRKMGAHEVVNRLTEDASRNDDPALTALVNKMLQDPSSAIRTIALSLIESRAILGDDYTVKLLQKMQNSKDGFGLDANQATSALLKMAGKTVEKEVPVTEAPKEEKTEKEKK